MTDRISPRHLSGAPPPLPHLPELDEEAAAKLAKTAASLREFLCAHSLKPLMRELAASPDPVMRNTACWLALKGGPGFELPSDVQLEVRAEDATATQLAGVQAIAAAVLPRNPPPVNLRRLGDSILARMGEEAPTWERFQACFDEAFSVERPIVSAEDARVVCRRAATYLLGRMPMERAMNRLQTAIDRGDVKRYRFAIKERYWTDRNRPPLAKYCNDFICVLPGEAIPDDYVIVPKVPASHAAQAVWLRLFEDELEALQARLEPAQDTGTSNDSFLRRLFSFGRPEAKPEPEGRQLEFARMVGKASQEKRNAFKYAPDVFPFIRNGGGTGGGMFATAVNTVARRLRSRGEEPSPSQIANVIRNSGGFFGELQSIEQGIFNHSRSMRDTPTSVPYGALYQAGAAPNELPTFSETQVRVVPHGKKGEKLATVGADAKESPFSHQGLTNCPFFWDPNLNTRLATELLPAAYEALAAV